MLELSNEMLLGQVNNGLILMVLGMGVVFLFLTLLVFTTKFLSFFVKKYLPESTKPIVKMPAPAAASPSPHSAGAEIAAAIAAAVVRSKR